MENNNRNQGSDKKNNRTGVIICLIVALGLFLVFSIMNNQVKNATNKEITYDQFLQLLEDGNVKAVTITSSRLEIIPVTQSNTLYQTTYYTGLITMDTQLVERQGCSLQGIHLTAVPAWDICCLLLCCRFYCCGWVFSLYSAP